MPALQPYPAYRESGVPWLGDVPAHWETERAKRLFREVERPVRPSDEVVTCFRDGVVTLRKNRRVRGFTESLKEFGYQGIRRGDLVIHAMDAFAGAAGVSDSDGKGTSVYSVCVPDMDCVNVQYYAHGVREMARSQWILALSKGIRERSTDFRYSVFGSQLVPLPPPSEQTAIVRYLNYADRRIKRYIRAKQKLIALLTEQKQAIIHQAVTGRIDVRTGQPYPAYKFSGVEWLGEVPAHWGILPGRSCFCEKKEVNLALQVKTVLSLSYGQIVVKPPEKLRGLVPSSFETYQVVDPLNIVIRPIDLQNDKNSLRFGLSKHRGIITSAYLCFLTSNRLVSEYGYLLLHSYDLMKIFYGLGSGLRQNLDWTDFKYLPCTVPPPPEQNAIVEFLDASAARLDDGIVRAQREINLHHEYRTRLIADVVTGKLDVRAAAAVLPEVDPLADEDTPGDTLDTGSESDIDELDVILEEAEA